MREDLSKRLRRAGDRAADSLESSPLHALALFLIVYAVAAFTQSHRGLWYDELFTYYLCRMRDLSTIWAALKDGLDFTPPLLFILTRWTQHILGDSNTAFRLPSMLAFPVMSLCTFYFVRRRCGFLYGFAAMWFPLLTKAFYYASEARPYALVLAFCSLALVFWQLATEHQRRPVHLLGFTLSLAGALLSHCYAVLILIPFALAELARFAERRRPDWHLWAAFAAALPCILMYLPMLQNLSGYALTSISFEPGLSLAPRFYLFLLDQAPKEPGVFGWNQATWPLLIALVITILAKREVATSPEILKLSKIPRHEIVCLAGLLLLPFFGQLLAVTVTHSFMDRYALPAVIGFACLLPMLAWSATAGNRRTALAMVLLFSSWFVVAFGVWIGRLFHQNPFDLPRVEFSALPESLPIVISDPLLFLETNYRESSNITSRLRFLTERPSALRYTGTDLFDRGYYTMERWMPVKGKVQEFSDFLATNKHFLVYGPFANPEDWLMRRLTTGSFDLRLLGQFDGHSPLALLDVTVHESGAPEIH
jgi:Dolichyl-phosphate-mannose-protein mannosyltransferase